MSFYGVKLGSNWGHEVQLQQNYLLALPGELLLHIASLLIDTNDVIEKGKNLLFFKSVCRLTHVTFSQVPFISKAIEDAKKCVSLRREKWEDCQLTYDNVEEKIETVLCVEKDAYNTFLMASTVYLRKPTLANWEVYKKARTELEHAEVQAAEQNSWAQQLNSLGLSMLEILSMGKESH